MRYANNVTFKYIKTRNNKFLAKIYEKQGTLISISGNLTLNKRGMSDFLSLSLQVKSATQVLRNNNLKICHL